MLAGFAILKMIASIFSIGSGGVSAIFVPLLYAANVAIAGALARMRETVLRNTEPETDA